jgi:hypothetical protein
VVRDKEGRLLGDAVPIKTLRLLPAVDEYPNPQNQNFNDEIRMVGYEYDRRDIVPGENLAVTLFWQAIQDVTADYIVQVRLLDEAGKAWAVADGRPGDGASPSNAWQARDTLEDTHLLTIDPDAPPGTYRVVIALFDPESGRRQNIVGEDGHLIDSHLLLAPLHTASQIE